MRASRSPRPDRRRRAAASSRGSTRKWSRTAEVRGRAAPLRWRRRSVRREAIQVARAAGADQVVLAAAAAPVRGVPGRVAAARAVELAQLRRGVGGAARVVAARMVGGVGVGAAV